MLGQRTQSEPSEPIYKHLHRNLCEKRRDPRSGMGLVIYRSLAGAALVPGSGLSCPSAWIYLGGDAIAESNL